MEKEKKKKKERKNTNGAYLKDLNSHESLGLNEVLSSRLPPSGTWLPATAWSGRTTW